MVERGAEGAAGVAVLGSQRQLHQRLHWPIRAQQGVGEFEEGVRSCGQTLVEAGPEA